MMTDFEIPGVSSEQMKIVDQLAVEKYHLKLLQMMENAGRNLAHLARQQLLDGPVTNRSILVLAGSGGNGGGGMVAARRIHNWGGEVTVQCATSQAQLADVPHHQLKGLLAAGVPILGPDDPIDFQPDLIIDALLGYSVKGNPRPPMDSMIEVANRSAAPILALDLPTGLDPDHGQPREPTIRAKMTLTLALPKVGLLMESAGEYVGELWLADISIPGALYHEMGLNVPKNLFAQNDFFRLNP